MATTPSLSSASDHPEHSLDQLNRDFEKSAPDQILRKGHELFGEKMVLSTGFGASGVVLMHQLSLVTPGATVFFLDTGLLFDETYELIGRIEQRMNVRFERVLPELSLEEQAAEHGEKLWETQPDLCCEIRKVRPLKAFLSDKEAWITAIRRDQSPTRKDTPVFQKDSHLGVIKISPLATWTEEDIWTYIRLNELPYNPLHDQGYPSIGCFPCTRPVQDGEDIRAGRWAGSSKTECGIHKPS
ncbi:phosphoadenylyl-sulfate reductase [Balneolaceae bacterium ANBcel3]|nr:phosphoadenylyl-sulfate reductase [Balneolaceae bacterium ANBcel3]